MTDNATQRAHQRLDIHEQRLGHVEGLVKSLQSTQSRQDDRIEKVERISQQLLLSMAQVQVQLNNLEKTVVDENRENRSIINQLLAYDQKRDEQMARASEVDKQRWQERWLKVWSVIGPLAAALITALFGNKP